MGKNKGTGVEQQDIDPETGEVETTDETTIVDLSEVAENMQDTVERTEINTESNPNITDDTIKQQETVNTDENSTENNGAVVTGIIDSETDNDTTHRHTDKRVKLVTDQIDKYLNQIYFVNQDRTITAVMKQSIININTCNIIVVLYNAYSAFTVPEIIDIIKYIKNNKYNYLREIKATNSTGNNIFMSRYKLHEAIVAMVLISEFVFPEDDCTDIDISVINKISDAFLTMITDEE